MRRRLSAKRLPSRDITESQVVTTHGSRRRKTARSVKLPNETRFFKYHRPGSRISSIDNSSFVSCIVWIVCFISFQSFSWTGTPTICPNVSKVKSGPLNWTSRCNAGWRYLQAHHMFESPIVGWYCFQMVIKFSARSRTQGEFESWAHNCKWPSVPVNMNFGKQQQRQTTKRISHGRLFSVRLRQNFYRPQYFSRGHVQLLWNLSIIFFLDFLGCTGLHGFCTGFARVCTGCTGIIETRDKNAFTWKN